MTQDEFKNLIETYGSSEARWPEDYKAEMLGFVKTHPTDAQNILDAERSLDLALDSVRLEPGIDMLKARILSSLPKEDIKPLPVAANDRSFGQKAVAALMLFAFAFGFTGASFLKLPGISAAEAPIYANQEWEDIATDYGMDDVYEWVGISDQSPAP